MALTQEQIQKAREMASQRGQTIPQIQSTTTGISLIDKYKLPPPQAIEQRNKPDTVMSKVKDITSGFLKGAATSIVKPVETIANTVTDVVGAGADEIGSRIAGTDDKTFSERLQQEAEGRKGTGIVSTIDPTQTAQTRDITTSKGSLGLAGDVLQTASLLAPTTGIAKGIAGATGSKMLGAVATGALTGYGTDVGINLSDEEDLNEALKPGIATAIGTAIPLAPYLIRTAGSIGKKTGEKLVEAVIPKSSREADILLAYKANKPLPERISNVLKGTSKPPQGAYKTTVEKGLMGTKSMIGIQANRASKKLWNGLIEPQLKASKIKIDLPVFFDTIKKNIIEENADLGRQKVLLEALDAVKDDYKTMKTIDLPQLQKFKEGWAKFVPEKVYRGKPIAGAYNDIRNQLADEARQTIYNTLGDDIKQAYFDYGNLTGLQEMGITSMTGQKLKGGSGTFISEILSQAITPIGTIGGRVIYKLGNGLEIIGKAGVKTLEEALELTGKSNQVLSQPIKTQTSQTIANQNKNVNIPSNISDNISQVSSKVKKNVDKSLWNKFKDEMKKPKKAFIKIGSEVDDDLLTQAKKYKTPEEFVKAQGDYFHGTSNKIEGKLGDKTKGIWLAEDPNIANKYIGDGILGTKGEVYYVKPTSKLNIKDIYQKGDFSNFKELTPELETKLIKEGYDGIRLNDAVRYEKDMGSGAYWDKSYHPSIRIFGNSKNKLQSLTKSQLEEIWNKANKN